MWTNREAEQGATGTLPNPIIGGTIFEWMLLTVVYARRQNFHTALSLTDRSQSLGDAKTRDA